MSQEIRQEAYFITVTPPKEFERRYLVPFTLASKIKNSKIRYVNIVDMYVEADRCPPLRFRKTLSGTASETRATLKIGKGAERIEYEWAFSGEVDFPTSSPVLEKSRYLWEERGQRFHIEFLNLPNATHAIGEVEFQTMEELRAFKSPEGWLEITGEDRFSNFSLAKHGWP